MRDLQHATADCERALGLHAIVPDRLVLYDVAVLGDVPRRAVVLAVGIDGVFAGLDVDADGPQDHEGDVERERDDGVEDVEEPQCDFDEVEEHADDADVEVVVCVTGEVG